MGFPFGKSEQLFRDARHPYPQCESHLKEGEQNGSLIPPEGSQAKDRSIARSVSCKEAAYELKAEREKSGKRLSTKNYRNRLHSLAMDKYPENVAKWMRTRQGYEKRQEENLQALKQGSGSLVAWAIGGLETGAAWAWHAIEPGTSWALNWTMSGIEQAFHALASPSNPIELPALEYGSKGPPHMA